MKLSHVSVESKNSLQAQVLVVDSDPKACEALRKDMGNPMIEFRQAATPEQAMLELHHRPAEIVVINLQISDNQGVDLLRRIARAFPTVEPIALTKSHRFELCVAALRAGAKDMICIPGESNQVQQCLQNAIARIKLRQHQDKRHKRLRSVCKKLNKARHEISQQVDLLCKDLVSAYRELAQRVYEAPSANPVANEFLELIHDDLDAESLLRKTMEFILKKVGPVNAAAFLPNSEGDYALGAYLNYDTASNSMLIDVVSDGLVKLASKQEQAMNLATDLEIMKTMGDEQTLLLGRHWMACGTLFEGECFGVLTVFRNQAEPLDFKVMDLLDAICAPLGHQIARVLTVHNRSAEDDEEASEDAGSV